jgi:hypothetical protein
MNTSLLGWYENLIQNENVALVNLDKDFTDVYVCVMRTCVDHLTHYQTELFTSSSFYQISLSVCNCIPAPVLAYFTIHCSQK